jgi:beta-phosphoglucomutase-like phosphatase (HAD superfamily)
MGYLGATFDVDGVLVDSPHELAWRQSLRVLMENDWRDIRGQTTYSPEVFTPAVYQEVMAGMPRMSGARGALEHFGVPDVERRAQQYAVGKQEMVVELIEAGRFNAFPTRCGSSSRSRIPGSTLPRPRRPRTPRCSSATSDWTPSPTSRTCAPTSSGQG